MANTPNPWHSRQTIDGAAIVEMQIADGDESDYENSFTDPSSRSMKSEEEKEEKRPDDASVDLRGQVASSMTTMVWEAGKQQAKQAFTNYTKIDILRPYFDVDPMTVRKRLIQSFVPEKPGVQAEHAHVPSELYGPSMVVLTLVAILLFQMKDSEHSVQEGTLMGSALMTCFGYWLGVSAIIAVLSYVCNTRLSLLQVLTLLISPWPWKEALLCAICHGELWPRYKLYQGLTETYVGAFGAASAVVCDANSMSGIVGVGWHAAITLLHC